MKNKILTSLIIFEDGAGYSLRSITPVLDVQNKLNKMEIKKWKAIKLF